MFQITAPVDNFEKIKFFEKIGVKDFYAGGGTVYDWGKKYNYITYINGRAAKTGNFLTINDFVKSIEYCKKKKLNIAVTFNHLPSISDDKVLMEEINNMNNILNPENIIIYDYLSGRFINKKKGLYISNQATIYDKETLKERMKTYSNIKRLIFPRDIILNNLEFFLNDKNLQGIDFEIFIKNQWCYHTNNCTSMHEVGIKEGIPIFCNRENKIFKKDNNLTKELKPLLNSKTQCKLCSLYQVSEIIKKTGYKKDIFLKIVGRTMTKEKIFKDIFFIKHAIDLLKNNQEISLKEFLIKNIKLHKKIWKFYCNYKNCEYYQEVKTSK